MYKRQDRDHGGVRPAPVYGQRGSVRGHVHRPVHRPDGELSVSTDVYKRQKLLIELMNMIYRFILILLYVQGRMSTAARARLGYEGFRRSCYTFGNIAGNLLILSFRKAGIYYCLLYTSGSDRMRNRTEDKMKITLIRHGMTKGNEEKRYIGTTDEDLSPSGVRALLEAKEAGRYPKADLLYISPMRRCVPVSYTHLDVYKRQEYDRV